MNHHTNFTRQPLLRPARSTIHLVVVAVLVAAALSGCGLFRTVLEVHNETDEELTVIAVVESGGTSGTIDLGNMSPGTRVEIEDECMLADMVVVDADDVEVARFPGPFCAEDSPWVITQDMLP
ncbi:MAG: hypothetical protein ACFCVC_17790 [Acidimicrobiia bacterium]